jgi:pantothenate kinase
VGIAGGPGSGKSTAAQEVCARINSMAGCPVAVVVPMDGFHYYRRELDAMADPTAAHARRGAPWTFDAAKYVACLRGVVEKGRRRGLGGRVGGWVGGISRCCCGLKRAGSCSV